MSAIRLGLVCAALIGLAVTWAASGPAVAGGWGHGYYGHGKHGYGKYGHGKHGYGKHGHRHYRHRHHSHSSFSLGLSFLVPLYRSPPGYYYAPPPRVVYVDPPRVCRRFHGDARVDASGGLFYGTACLLGDGRWHIVK